MANKNLIYTQITSSFKDRTRADIQKWRSALVMAENDESPHPASLQDMYDNLSADGHFIAQVGLRKAATTGYGFSIVDKKSGEIYEEKTELFNTEWFYTFIDNALDSLFFGYTLMELQDPSLMKFALLPRRNVAGRKGLVFLNDSGDKKIDITKGYERTLIHCGDKSELGLMANLCGLLIWKRNAQQSWAEFTEKFGMPLISATTSRTDPASVNKVNSMLKTLGEAATAVLPEGTSITVTPFTGGDSYNVYNEQIERINGEISKAIVGGTMTTDNGSSRSQSEVHERNLDDKIAETDRRMIQFIVNNQLIPMMQYWGWNVNADTDKFLFDTSFELSLSEHWNIVSQMMQRYDVDMDWLAKTFNVPIIGERKDIGGMGGGLSGNFG